MLDIYRKLPKTNCGDCGEPACMAFAAKVKSGQRTVSECPHVEAPADEMPLSDTPRNGAPDPYAEVAARMQTEVQAMDYRTAASVAGGEWASDGAGESIRLTMLGRSCDVGKEGLFVDGAPCDDVWDRMILYDYVRRQGPGPASTEWSTVDQFPRTPSHVKAFQKSAEQRLSGAFAQDPTDLQTRLTTLGATDTPSRVKCDYACRVMLLPHVVMVLQFLAADDEFPASCKLFVNSNANTFLDMEFLGHLLEKVIEQALD